MSVRDRKGENRGKISPIIFMCVAGLTSNLNKCWLTLISAVGSYYLGVCLTGGTFSMKASKLPISVQQHNIRDKKQINCCSNDAHTNN
jgi:hypothetical protein